MNYTVIVHGDRWQDRKRYRKPTKAAAVKFAKQKQAKGYLIRVVATKVLVLFDSVYGPKKLLK